MSGPSYIDLWLSLIHISDESPIGAALIGHSVGDKVDITLPSGAVVQYEVMEIGRAEL